MKFQDNIKKLNRIQTSQNRDLLSGINLDRNEKVDIFDLKIQKKIKKNLSKNIFNTTPDVSSLYKSLSNHLKVDVSNIYLTQGITEAIFQIIFSLTNKKDEIIIMSETYPMYEIICKLNDIKIKTWNFNKNFQLELSDFKKKITNKTKIVFLVNPNLPIEYEFNEKVKSKIYQICKKKNILLVYDEAYFGFGAKSELYNSVNKKNLLVMRTFSKAWGLPGIRLGFIVGQKKIIEYISKCRSLVETNGFSFEIAKWALKNKSIFKDHVKSVKEGYKFLKDNLQKMSISYHGGKITNAIILDLKSKKNSLSLKNFLRKNKIYIRDGFKYPIENYVRISLCSPEKLRIFLSYFKKWQREQNI